MAGADSIYFAVGQGIKADSGVWYKNIQTLGTGANAVTFLVANGLVSTTARKSLPCTSASGVRSMLRPLFQASAAGTNARWTTARLSRLLHRRMAA